MSVLPKRSYRLFSYAVLNWRYDRFSETFATTQVRRQEGRQTSIYQQTRIVVWAAPFFGTLGSMKQAEKDVWTPERRADQAKRMSEIAKRPKTLAHRAKISAAWTPERRAAQALRCLPPDPWADWERPYPLWAIWAARRECGRPVDGRLSPRYVRRCISLVREEMERNPELKALYENLLRVFRRPDREQALRRQMLADISGLRGVSPDFLRACNRYRNRGKTWRIPDEMAATLRYWLSLKRTSAPSRQ